MKKFLILVAAASTAIFAGCASTQPVGVWYTEVSLPGTVTEAKGDVAKLKVGTSKCESLLNLVTRGDASIAAAMKNGGISEVHVVDWKAKSILGIISDYECVVYGE